MVKGQNIALIHNILPEATNEMGKWPTWWENTNGLQKHHVILKTNKHQSNSVGIMLKMIASIIPTIWLGTHFSDPLVIAQWHCANSPRARAIQLSDRAWPETEVTTCDAKLLDHLILLADIFWENLGNYFSDPFVGYVCEVFVCQFVKTLWWTDVWEFPLSHKTKTLKSGHACQLQRPHLGNEFHDVEPLLWVFPDPRRGVDVLLPGWEYHERSTNWRKHSKLYHFLAGFLDEKVLFSCNFSEEGVGSDLVSRDLINEAVAVAGKLHCTFLFSTCQPSKDSFRHSFSSTSGPRTQSGKIMKSPVNSKIPGVFKRIVRCSFQWHVLTVLVLIVLVLVAVVAVVAVVAAFFLLVVVVVVVVAFSGKKPPWLEKCHERTGCLVWCSPTFGKKNGIQTYYHPFVSLVPSSFKNCTHHQRNPLDHSQNIALYRVPNNVPFSQRTAE